MLVLMKASVVMFLLCLLESFGVFYERCDVVVMDFDCENRNKPEKFQVL